MNDQEYQNLIPELKTVNEGKPLPIEIWLEWIGEYTHAIAYLTLFWPEFIEYEGCVFIGREPPETYQEWKEKFKGNVKSIEEMLNHHHLFDVFGLKQGTPEQILFLGRKLKELWFLKLTRDYPDKKFIVELDKKFDQETDNPEITFYQKDSSVTISE